jgi:hypothetical protein
VAPAPAAKAAIANEAQLQMQMRGSECKQREAGGVNANEGRGGRTKLNGRGEHE